ncbi:MAG: DJ-1/PfpI/YhbO family deglycase/protease [Candidatus Harrisonbacteria bacterium]|nr:DJ-1/PfpI/YhbO family deglycase/protease [Candidatus Harrisonbacteria bacterium]
MRVLMFVDEEFDDDEVLYPRLQFEKAGIPLDIAAKDGKEKFGKKGAPAGVNRDMSGLSPEAYDLVIVPGGYRSPDRLRTYDEVLNFLRAMDKRKKLIASICHGPWVLISAGIVRGRKVTGHRGTKDELVNAGANYRGTDVMVDGNLITASHPRHVAPFMEEVLVKLRS